MERGIDRLTDKLVSRRRPGLMTRLSHLIIVQVVFVFAALVLIIYNPSSDATTDVAAYSSQTRFTTLARTAAPLVAGCEPDSLTARASATGLEGALAAEDDVVAASVYRFTANQPHQVYEYYRDTSARLHTDLGEVLAPPILITADDGSRHDRQPVFPARLTDKYLVTGWPIVFGDGTQGVLVAAWEHGLVLSDRSALGYALFLLFLVAALIALLTVYLIHRRFTQPYRQLIQRLEKTSDGELYYLLENAGDEELARLASAFNKLSTNLLDGHRQLTAFDEKLRDASTSLEESQLLLSTVIAHSPIGVITTGPSGRILLINRKATEIFGFDEAAAIGRPVGDLFGSDIEERARRHEGEADEHGLEAIGRRADSTSFAAYVITSTLRNDQGTCIGYVYIVRDISERKDYQAMLIRLDRYYTKGEMAGEIAHEINNFLSILMGNIELVPLLLKKGNMERLDQKLELMHGTVEKIARLTDGMLDGSRDQIHPEPCDISQIIQSVAAYLKPQNKFDNTDLVLDLSSELPLAHLDPGHMQQVLVNLVYNAGEAVFAQEGERRIRVSTAAVPHDGVPALQIIISDNGPGVAAEKLPLLFRKRFTTKPHGHGIGLIACRKIVEAHAGAIAYRFDSGAVFTITIPIEQPHAQSTPGTAPSHERPVTANF